MRRRRDEGSLRWAVPIPVPPSPLVLLLAATVAFKSADCFSSVSNTRLRSGIGAVGTDSSVIIIRRRHKMCFPDTGVMRSRPPKRSGRLRAVAIPLTKDDDWWKGSGSDSESQMESPIRTIGGRKNKVRVSKSSSHGHKSTTDSRHSGTSSSKSGRSSSSSRSRNKHGRSSSNKGDSNGGSRRKIHRMFRQARDLERTGQWREAASLLRDILDIDPRDAYSHLALARLEARREGRGPQVEGRRSPAREAFRVGTEQCPESVHLWQAWAVHEQSRGKDDRARELFDRALEIDGCNSYVCHAFGLMEQREGNSERAKELWERALDEGGRSTAALVCSLGELYSSSGRYEDARLLYDKHVNRVQSERETTEIYLAASWLEERHFGDINRAAELLNMALKRSPGNTRAQVALARLEGRRDSKTGKNIAAVRKRLEEACTAHTIGGKSSVRDGRLFNAWAKLEVKAGNLRKARQILKKGNRQFPEDQSLLQAAGKVEERLGNFVGAREMYSSSLSVEPSAPTLVAYALLELRHPPKNRRADIGKIRRLFEEALLLDPRHGPAYNAYGNMEFQRGDADRARDVFQRGVKARCSDAASVYHGLGKLELSLGNIEEARDILRKGLKQVEMHEGMMETNHLKRAVFLAHTLGMLELNSNRVQEASEVFERGLKRHTNSSQLLLGAALCEVKLGKEDEARKFFESAVNADRKHAQAWQAWAVMEMRASHYKVAKTLLECGLKEAPEHGALWQAYATMESRRANFDVARTLFAAGVQKCPKHVPLYQGWACLELRGGNYDRAKVLVSEALTRDKKQGLGWLVSARIEEKQGNDGLAAMLLRRGLECAPNDASLYCALGELEVRQGRIDEARDVLEKGLSIDPLHAPLYHSLAELEARVFNLDGLAKLNKRAAGVFNSNALVPPPASTQAWGTKIKMAASSTSLPECVAALAAKVGVEEDLDIESSLWDINPDTTIEGLASHKPNDSNAKRAQAIEANREMKLHASK